MELNLSAGMWAKTYQDRGKGKVDIDAHIERFLRGSEPNKGLAPNERYASFDYCFNYFQACRESGCVEPLAAPARMQESCLQIGFYLASWGMFRGRGFLLQKSAKFYEPLIRYVTATERELWEIDVDRYTEENLDRLIECEYKIVEALWDGGHASATLVTKIMLGIFGNLPAFDRYFVEGFGIRWNGKKGLRRVAEFYEKYRSSLDCYDIPTLEFTTGQPIHRKYPKAKRIDMVGFIEGRGFE